ASSRSRHALADVKWAKRPDLVMTAATAYPHSSPANGASRCPVCASADASEQYRHTDRLAVVWTVFRCARCGLRFLDPMPSWAELQPYYQGDYYAYAEGEGDSAEEQLKTAAATGELRHAPVKSGTRLLDVGC